MNIWMNSWLLLDASSGTRFHHFVDELVRIEVEYTYKYMEAIGCTAKLGNTLTERLLHIVTTLLAAGSFIVGSISYMLYAALRPHWE